jgi:hypothetical protein
VTRHVVNSNSFSFLRRQRVDKRNEQHGGFTSDNVDDRLEQLNGKLLDVLVRCIHLQEDWTFVDLTDLSVDLDVFLGRLRCCGVPAEEVQIAEDLLV